MHIGSFAARALALLTPPRDTHFASLAASATDVLQHQWYNAATGLWNSTGWWNSANALTVLGDYAYRGAATGTWRADIRSVMANTFDRAQQTSSSAVSKSYDADGMVHSFLKEKNVTLEDRGFHGFINDYYDDEGWWALAWIRAYDVTLDTKYLDMAASIVADMAGGGDGANGSCGGGIWWSKARGYKNAIANELYLSVLANLANRVLDPDERANYTTQAADQWTWFKNSGMINADLLINDGLKISDDGTCANNNGGVWTYNQGVVLGGLVELYAATGDASLITTAVAMANASIAHLVDGDGVLHEWCDRNGGSCGGDGATFKGVFVRNLGYLCEVDGELIDDDTLNAFHDFIRTNANSIWDKDRTDDGLLGLSWSGPPDSGMAPTAATHASAMDCLVAAASL